VPGPGDRLYGVVSKLLETQEYPAFLACAFDRLNELRRSRGLLRREHFATFRKAAWGIADKLVDQQTKQEWKFLYLALLTKEHLFS